MNPWMWVLSTIQVAFGLSFPALFQVWRFVALVLFVTASLVFLRTVVRDRGLEVTARIVTFAGAGFGWVLVLLKKALGERDVPFPTDVYTVEPNTFWGLLSYPYLPLGQAFILFIVTAAWMVRRGDRRWAFVLAGASSLLLALTHAYDLIIVYTVLGSWGLLCWVRSRRFPTELFAVGLVIAVCSGPVALYYRALTAHDPLWRAILAQYANAGVWTPRHVHLIVLMGLPLVMAMCGLFLRHRWNDDAFWLVATWTVVGFGLIYLPTVYQIKMLAGWQVPMAVLSTYFWHDRVLPRFGWLIKGEPVCRMRGSTSLVGAAVLVTLIVPTNAYLYLWRFTELRLHSSPYYFHRDQVAALDWLAQQKGEREVVLAPLSIGQFVPNYGRSRAYLAHWAMTNRFYERSANVDKFLNQSTSDPWRDELISREGITMILRTGTASELATMYDPGGSPLFEEVMVLPRAQLYRVRKKKNSVSGAVTGSRVMAGSISIVTSPEGGGSA
jgi:hypothetical protein